MQTETIIQQIWPQWIPVEELGKGSYGTVYKAVRSDNNINSVSAIKVISIPQERSEVEELISEGMSEAETRTYFKGIVKDFVGEVSLMDAFKGMPNIVSIEDYAVVEKEGDLGWDILVRMELLTPFDRYIRTHKMSEADVIRLGTDICTALDLCGKRNIIHRDVKPENIFVNDFDYFKLGDFGIAKKLENLGASHSQKGTFNYMAPEVANGTHYDARVDIYSLGIVLYRLLNHNCLPFIDETNRLNPTARKNALERRLNGEPLPAPSEASEAMANVILRATAFRPEDRFKTAAEFKKALEEVKAGTYAIVPLPFMLKAAVPSNPLEEISSAPVQNVVETALQETGSADLGSTTSVHKPENSDKPVLAKKKEKSVRPKKSEKKSNTHKGNDHPEHKDIEKNLVVGQQGVESIPASERTGVLEKTQSIKDRHLIDRPEVPVDATVALVQTVDHQKTGSTKKSKRALFIALGVLLTAAIVTALILLLKNCKPSKNDDRFTDSSFEATESIENPVIDGLKTLEIESLPEKMSYHVGDELNTSGLTLTASYEDGSKKTITDGYEYSPKRLMESGTKEITVFYGGKETTFMVVVSPSALVSLNVRTAPAKTRYYLGQSIDLTGLTLEAIYSDGSKEIITDGFESTVDVLTSSGMQDIRVSLDGQEITIQITVDEVSLNGLSIISEPKKKSYLIGERMDTTGLKLLAAYNNGENEEIETNYSISPELLSRAGRQAITVTYGNQTATFNVEVSDLKIETVSIAQQPVKKDYFTGDALETAGMVLKVKYSNGKEEDVQSGFTCSPNVLNSIGTQRVTVYYGEKNTTFDVSVEAAILTSISVRTNPTKINYLVGERLSTDGLSLTATYSNRKTEMITSGFTCSPTELKTIGTESITVTYQGKTAVFQVNVQDVVLSSISIKTNPNKANYYEGDSLDNSGLTLTATYSNEKTETISEGFVCSPTVLNNPGTQRITVSYEGLTTTFDVIVAKKELASITVKSNPSKMSYYVGDSLNTSGLTLTANYNNGETEMISTGFTCSPTSLQTAGNQLIEVSFNGKTTSFTVTVLEKAMSSISIKTNPTKTAYYVGDTLDTTGLTLTASYNNGDSISVFSGFTCSPTSLSYAGTQKITVNYEGKTTTFNVSVTEVELNSISIRAYPTKTTYTAGEPLDTTGLSLDANYNNGTSKTITSGFTCSPTALNTAGTATITVTYQGKTTMFKVQVNPNVNIGDIITFGPYQWVVLEKNGSNVMLISKESVANKNYNETYAKAYWETCTLRSWLNTSFLGGFSSADQAKILTTPVKSINQIYYGQFEEKITYDKVFLLSDSEARMYFESDAKRICYTNGTPTTWVLRSQSYSSYSFDFVALNGAIQVDGISGGGGIRPVIWVKLGS